MYQEMIFKRVWVMICMLLPVIPATAQVTADFKADRTNGCLPQLIRFEDLSLGNPTSWRWDFGNGNTSSLQNPSLIYTAGGSYTITLTAGDASGQHTVTKTAYITIYDNPRPDFSVNNTTACEEVSFNFTDNSLPAAISNAPITSYFWDMGDGNTYGIKSPAHAYHTSGQMSVLLKVTDANGCKATKEYPGLLTIHPKPDIDFTTAKSNSCVSPLVVDFINQTSGGLFTYSWNFGDGNTSAQENPQNTYITSGSFDVVLMAADPVTGCRDTLAKPGFISTGNNVADFTVSKRQTCEGDAVTFNINGTAPLFTYWDFGDGGTGTGIPAQYAYASPGQYTVKAVVGYSSGCIDTVTKVNFIAVDQRPVPVYALTPKSSCQVPFNITFVNNTPGTSSSWDFGDGDTSTQKNIIHTYAAYGPWIIAFKAITPGGCEAIRSDTIDFSPNIKITHDTNQFCGDRGTVRFDFTSEPAAPTAWNWDFGDGQFSNQLRPVHNFTGEGTYLVTLTLNFGPSCQATGFDTVYVYTEPVPDFVTDKQSACVKKVINFTNLSTNFTSFIWGFGDGAMDSVNVSPQHNYRSYSGMPVLPDTFDISLTLFNGTCRKDTIFKNHIAINPPLAWFEPVISCDTPGIVVLTDISRYLNPRDTVTRIWYFNDPNALRINGQQCTTDTRNGLNIGRNCNYSRDSIATHEYKRIGDYEVKLWVYSKRTQCADSLENTIRIRLPYAARYTLSDTTGCAPLTVSFQDTTRRSRYWFWDFGNPLIDSDTDIVRQTQYTYNRPGNYLVQMVAEDIEGCRAIYRRTIKVKGPQANFRTDGKVCPPDTVRFRDLSTLTDPLVRWRWRFGDPASGALDSSLQQHPSHHYSRTGNYIVELTVYDSLGCSHAATRIVEYGPPKPNFFVRPATVCKGMPVDIVNITPNAFANTYSWRLGNGDTSRVLSPVYVYPDTGTYSIQLIATRNDGCRDSLTLPQAVSVVLPQVDFAADTTQGLCPPFAVNFRSFLSKDIQSVQWDFGDSATSVNLQPLHTYTRPGVYTVKLVVKSAGGCYDTLVKQNYIRLGGPAGKFTVSPLAGCAPLQVRLKAESKDADLYTWDLGDGNVINDIADSAIHVYGHGAVFRPVLILTDSNGCSLSFASKDSIVVHDQPAAVINSVTKSLCVGGTATFSDQSTAKVPLLFRQWLYNNTPTGNAATLVQNFDTLGQPVIRLIVADSLGCADTAAVLIDVRNAPVAVVSNDTAVCAGATVQLMASGGIDYEWSPATGLSSVNVPDPVAAPAVTTTYTVSVGGGANCPRSTAKVVITVRQPPPVEAGMNGMICLQDSLQLFPSGADTLRWVAASGLTDTTLLRPWVKPGISTWYTVKGIDNLGCTNTDSVWVEVVPPPVSRITGPDIACLGAAVRLEAAGGDAYRWSTGENTAVIQPRIATDTTFWATATDRGCAGDTAYKVVKIVSSLLRADFQLDSDTFYAGQQISLLNTSTGATSYQWRLEENLSFDLQPVFTRDEEGTYALQLVVRNADGCTDSTTRHFLVLPDYIYFPNAFTPNADSYNRLYQYVASYALHSVEFVIVDRWGEVIFRSEQANEFWDGSYKGVPVPEGVYGFYFRARKHSGKFVQYKGNITLLR